MMNIQTLKDEQEEVQLCISAEGYFLNMFSNSMIVKSCHAKSIKKYFILMGKSCRIKKEGTESRLIFNYRITR